jgi:hypothetical protein
MEPIGALPMWSGFDDAFHLSLPLRPLDDSLSFWDFGAIQDSVSDESGVSQTYRRVDSLSSEENSAIS